MKTRSSSGVNSKIDLEFDVDSLRIRDLGEDEEYKEFEKRKSTVFDQIKRGNQTSVDHTATTADPAEGDTVGKIRAEASTSQLRSFLNNLGNE